MSDNQDLKSKILSMRQKNFGEEIDKSSEKNDNEKPINTESEDNKATIDSNVNKDEISENKIQKDTQHEMKPEIFELKENLNKVAKTNEKAFDLLANKFNESVEVILELTQRVEKLETVTKLQAMQESVKKTEVKSSQRGLKFFIFLLLVAAISYFFYKFKIDLSILKDISKDFLAIVGR